MVEYVNYSTPQTLLIQIKKRPSNTDVFIPRSWWSFVRHQKANKISFYWRISGTPRMKSTYYQVTFGKHKYFYNSSFLISYSYPEIDKWRRIYLEITTMNMTFFDIRFKLRNCSHLRLTWLNDGLYVWTVHFRVHIWIIVYF